MTVVADRFSDRYGQEAWFVLARDLAPNVHSYSAIAYNHTRGRGIGIPQIST